VHDKRKQASRERYTPHLLAAGLQRGVSETPPRWVRETPPRWVRETPPRWVRETPPRWVSETPPRWVRETPPRWVSETPPRWVRETLRLDAPYKPYAPPVLRLRLDALDALRPPPPYYACV
jgi:hypothetical protein